MTLSAEQRDLRAAVRDLLADHDGPDLWPRLAGELGLTALPVPESRGGAGGSTVDLAVVLVELGRALSAVPYLQTAVAATVLAEAELPGVLPAIAVGSLVAGLAPPGAEPPLAAADGTGVRVTGRLAHVVDGPRLDLLLTPARYGGETVLVALRLPGAGVEVHPEPTVDRTRPQAGIVLDCAPAVVVGDGTAASAATDLLLTAVAVESAGAAAACLDATVAHLRTREQFGRPLGTFQALQHRCADLAVAVESASATAWYAAWAAGADPAAAAIAGPLAKLHCARVFREVAGEMIQLHGGIGFTWEHPAHRYFKRATATDLLFGGRAWARELLARRAGLR